MIWIRKNLWEISFNILAFVIFYLLCARLVQSNLGDFVPNEWAFIPRYRTSQIIGTPIFQDAGHWAIRFLLISLAMTPIYTYFRWRPALRLRKPAGLWAFAFAGLHVWLFAGDITWGKMWMQTYTRIGLAAFIILALLTLTSNRLSMRLLGKNWKRLHRVVYVAGVLAILHGLLAASDWNDIITASRNIWEMRLYCILLVLLLLVRIPMVKTLVVGAPRKRKQQPEYANNPF